MSDVVSAPKQFDSTEEKKFYERVDGLIPVGDKPLLGGGKPFCDGMDWWDAYGDFYVKAYGYVPKHVIEFKCHALNNQLHRSQANRILEGVKRKQGKPLDSFGILDLKMGFNHSIQKNVIVQNKLWDMKKCDFVVVFADDTKLTKSQIQKMNDADLNWCREWEYLMWCDALQGVTAEEKLLKHILEKAGANE